MRASTLVLVLCLVPLAAAAPLRAQDRSGPASGLGVGRGARVDVEAAPRPLARAVRISSAPRIDGTLDDPIWVDAEVITGFIQAQPDEGAPATERTEVRIVYDGGTLYIGAECFDSDPSALVVPSLEQDFESGDSDILGFTLDTYHDRRNAFMFLFNPQGAVKEAQNYGDSRFENQEWEGVIDVQTTIHERGWTLEVAIPFSTLRFDPKRPDQTWGLQILRRVRRKNEDAYWAPMDRRNRIHRMSKAGTLQGLSDLRAGRNFSIKPYALAARTQGTLPPDPGNEWDGGLDLKYGVTSGVTMDLTWRTDFSQVEVDQEQVNLTRFSLFFPERRDFFVENSGFFTLGDITERNYRAGSSLRDFTVFHSRRIGLEGGVPVPIEGGGRLSGRAGEFEFGLLDMQTRSEVGGPAENFGVLRVRRNLPGNNDVGAIFTNRQDTEGEGTYNRVYGIDANVRPFENLVVNSYLIGTDDHVVGNDWAGRVQVGYRTRLVNTGVQFKQVGASFRPGIGFVRRAGVRHTYATFGLHPRPASSAVFEINPYVEVDYITDLESVLETRDVGSGVSVSFSDGANFGITARDRFERLLEGFNVGSVGVPAGDYDFREVGVSYRTSRGRKLAGNVSLTRGGYFGGNRTSISAGMLWRPNFRWSVDLGADRNAITLPAGTVDADVFAGRVVFAGSTRLFTSAFVQYNRATEDLVTSARFNLIHSPLSDVFLSLTERRNLGEDVVRERLIALKITKYLAF